MGGRQSCGDQKGCPVAVSSDRDPVVDALVREAISKMLAFHLATKAILTTAKERNYTTEQRRYLRKIERSARALLKALIDYADEDPPDDDRGRTIRDL